MDFLTYFLALSLVWTIGDLASKYIQTRGRIGKPQLQRLLCDPEILNQIEVALQERRFERERQIEEVATRMFVENDEFAGKIIDKSLEKR